jgi:hypothetical protein
MSKTEMKITVSRPINGMGINGDEFILGEDGNALEFDTVKEAVNFLADNNFTINDLRRMDFNVEKAEIYV